MCRIIIADDEAIECRALEMMIRNDFPDIEIIPSVSNGIDLIAAVEKSRPDIAIVDINMPGMNGLDALEVIRTRNESMRIIISTAYSEFEYAKRALLLGASDYILKPLNRETFCETLSGVVSKLQKDQKKVRDAQNAGAQVHEVNLVLGSEFLSSLMLGEPDEKSFQMLLERLGYEYQYCVLITVRNPEPERIVEKTSFQNLMEKMNAELNKFCHCVGKVHKGEICLLVFPDKSVILEQRDHWLSNTADILQTLANREGWPGLAFGISSWQSEPSEMAAGLSESRVAARSQGRPGICFYTVKNKKEKNTYSFIDVPKSIELLKKGQTEKCLQRIRAALDNMRIPDEKFATVQIGVLQAISLISDGLLPEGQSNISSYALGNRLDWKKLMQCRNKEELKQWLTESIRHLGAGKATLEKKSAEYIERTIIYMEQHYMEDISLEQTAGAAGISSFYLSRLLKQELKQTFVEILTEIRMRRALKMMWAGKYTVKEIAEQSGYSNITYFYKVFKKYTGMSVGEVREFME